MQVRDPVGVVSRRQTTAACAAAALGLLWHAGLAGVALSPLFLEVWRRARSRREAFANALAYYAGATLPMALVQGPYADVAPFEILLLALASASLLAGVWAVLWTGTTIRWVHRTAALVLVLVVTAAPGVGFFGLASPLTAAGAWFPGTGFVGLALLVLVASASRLSPSAARAAALCGAMVASVAHATSSPPPPARLEGLATQIETTDRMHDYLAQFRTAQKAQQAVQERASKGKVMVLGEGLGGVWTDAMRESWSGTVSGLAAEGTPLVLGATRPRDGRNYENGTLVMDAGGTRFVRQRAPLPYVMWRPWADGGSYDAHPWDSGVVDLAGSRTGLLICWEQLLVFPVLWSVLSGAQGLVGLSNLHHVGGAGVLEHWQRAALGSWGALFSLPTTYAVNR